MPSTGSSSKRRVSRHRRIGRVGPCRAGRDAHPVTYVSWADAAAFCRWAGGRLPSEAEWERAARADDGRTWPWGDVPPSAERAVFAAADTAPVGSCPGGASPFAVLDLAGNVWEWTASVLRPYPYAADDGREEAGSDGPRVVRGGSFIHGAGEIRCSWRHGMLPGVVDHYVGFRLAADPDRSLAYDGGMIDVPAGEVLLGNDPRPSAGPAVLDEAPQHEVPVAAVALSATPVTNAQFAAFVDATGHSPPPHWPGDSLPEQLSDHPVTHVDWHDASAFCRWLGGRLPTEAEWEKAARGTDARLYPWGPDEPQAERVPPSAAGPKQGGTTAVGAHADGASPYGLLDMAGNVWEWVSTVYAPYPYDAHDGREDQASGLPRVLRGGSFSSPTSRNLRCAARSRSAPGRRSPHIGFRVAASAAETSEAWGE